jgi:hypothetical protein
MIPETHYTTYDIVSHPESYRAVIACRNIWVWCVDGDPTKAVIYTGSDNRSFSLQGNSVKCIAEGIVPNLKNIELIFVEKYFKPYEGL